VPGDHLGVLRFEFPGYGGEETSTGVEG